MVVTFALIIAALVFYAIDRIPMELTSLGVICALLLFFNAFPITDEHGRLLVTSFDLLSGFANPALFAVLSLLVIGEGLIRTGVLTRGAQMLLPIAASRPVASTALALVMVVAISAFMNNIPVVVIAIPMMQLLARHQGRSTSSLMMPLSFAAILGGMTTLIGSSTNLLISQELQLLGEEPLGFFSFTIPGLVLAGTGFFYVLYVAPWVLPDRASMARALIGGSASRAAGGDDDGPLAGRQFVVQITVREGSRLIGQKSVGGFFPRLRDLTVLMLQRGERSQVPPFEDVEIRAGDVLMVAASRAALEDSFGGEPNLLHVDIAAPTEAAAGPQGDRWLEGKQVFAEVMVTPTSRMIGRSLELIGFRYQYGCIVCGIQRRARMIRQRLSEIRLEAGDVLLIQGQREDINALRTSPDVLLIEWTARDLPLRAYAKRALAIFLAVVGCAATGLVPIAIIALTGAVAMVAFGVLNMRQAARAVDQKILLMIPAALGLSQAMEATGGAHFIAMSVLQAIGELGPTAILSAMFAVIALLTNVMSNQATAVLFTPIAVQLARELGVDPMVFAIGVVFAANCSFASPVGYQTNLLVMAPGHYKFTDFPRAGLPLIAILWAVFTLFVPWWYGLS
ncbi:MAG: SLC13 family permease [Alphaproteobacteria bacterium]|nr:SLC13 family permease [Alphaproteobacteria bacterium]